MGLRTLYLVCVSVCLYLVLQEGLGDNALVTSFGNLDDDVNCDYFSKQELNESVWNKNSAKQDITSGNTAATQVHIAQIHLDLGKFEHQHIVRVCTVDCRKTSYEIKGYTIKSVGPHSGDALVFTNDNKQLTFSGQAHEKSQGFQFDVNVWGTLNGGNTAKPTALCISPRHIADGLDGYCHPHRGGCSGKGCGRK